MSEKKKLLLTGASGFLGWNICCRASEEWDIHGVYFNHPISFPGVNFLKADITDYKALRSLIEAISPQAVMHTAALSDPNFCALNPDKSRAINLQASLNLAGLCADRQIPLVFTSSDLIFDGVHPPYREEDPPCPINLYGEHKAMAEEGMRERNPEVIIGRLPLMFGDPGPSARSFLQPLLQAVKEGRELRLFADEFRTPLSGGAAVEGLFLALKKVKGILHLGGRESISRYHLGLLVKELLRVDGAGLIPCKQTDISMPALRPTNVSLDIQKALSLGFTPPLLREDLQDAVRLSVRTISPSSPGPRPG
jgi:dTDP-4-dehydrorhamnose reductase